MRLVFSPRSGRVALTAATAIVIIALGAGPAAATTAWTVTPGGKFTGTAGTTKLKDITNGNALACTQSSISGALKAGSGLNGAGASGIARVAYTDSAHTLKLLPAGGNLHFSNVSGCNDLFDNGDSAAYTATYTITPAQVITSP